MNCKPLTLSLSVAFAAMSGPALAATYGLGDLNTPLNTSTPVAGANSVSPGTFMDLLAFSLSTESVVGITIKDLPNFSLPTFSVVLDIFSLSGSLYDGANNVVAGLSFSSSGMVGSPLSVDQLTLDTTLAAGAYTLKLKGNSWGQAGGLYSYALVAQPVPEPEAWAMMLAGLGLVGFALRRRNAGKTRSSV